MSSEKQLLGPNGKPVPKGQAISYNNRFYPYRVVDQEVFQAVKVDAQVGFMAVLVQQGDQFNIMMLSMLALAKDMYSRQPAGSTEFLDLVEQLNMNIIDLERNSTSMASELRKIIPKATPVNT